MTRRVLSWLQLRSPAQVARLVMVTDASSALLTIADTSPVRALQSVQSAAPHLSQRSCSCWCSEEAGAGWWCRAVLVLAVEGTPDLAASLHRPHSDG